MIVAHKQNIQIRFGKHAESYKEHATVQKNICRHFVNLLSQVSFKPMQVLEIGCGVGFLTELFLSNYTVQSYTANDIVASMETEIQRIAKKTQKYIQFLAGDAENLPINQKFNCILSTSTLQWFYNIPLFFKKIQHNLLPQGMFAFSTFGTENFQEITALTGHSLHYHSAEELCALLADDFHIIHYESYCEILYFNTPTDVLRHIKHTGVNNFAASHWTKTRLHNFNITYCERFSTPQGVTLTYNPIIIIAQKK
ncbi:MAG: malonyl-ACP O-methyltransferase BioC [Bacteroidales bacterium]|jgi:malonyl-ACP O-methyltransferase BioC|nr:malonyl-ACP O-methyltransferase BioC [Bacteroidales bacterium]